MSSDEEDSSIRKESQFDESVDEFPDLSTSPHRHSQSSARRTTNTGPKGVRADARAYEAHKREIRSQRLAGKSPGILTVTATSPGESENEVSESEWMSRWREKRMKELSKVGITGVTSFGQVDDVDARGYLAAVDYDETGDDPVTSTRGRATTNIVTAVLVYNNSPDCRTLFQVFSKLARRHPTVHFLRMPSQYAEDMPTTALPTVLAYKRGELIANLVHFVDELPPGVSLDISSTETILSKEGVIPLDDPESDVSS